MRGAPLLRAARCVRVLPRQAAARGGAMCKCLAAS